MVVSLGHLDRATIGYTWTNDVDGPAGRICLLVVAASGRMRELKTELDALSEQLASSYETMSLLYSVIDRVRRSPSPEEFGESVLEWIAEILPAVARLENAYAPDPFRRSEEGRLPTAYELLWRAEGRDFHFFDYVRRGD